MNDIIVYTDARCGYCDQLKEFLKTNQIDYTEKEVSNKTYIDELMELQGRGVPFTLIHNRPFEGFNDEVKAALMKYKAEN